VEWLLDNTAELVAWRVGQGSVKLELINGDGHPLRDVRFRLVRLLFRLFARRRRNWTCADSSCERPRKSCTPPIRQPFRSSFCRLRGRIVDSFSPLAGAARELD